MAPNPYKEILPPFLVDSAGKPLSASGAENSGQWPVFIRAALIGKSHEIWKYPNPSWKLYNYPGPFLWGGPFQQSYYEQIKRDLEQWAFSVPLNTVFGPEPGFFVVSEKRLIAPNTGVTPWPGKHGFWQWVSEPGPAAKYRVVQQSGFQGGKLERVG